MRFRGKGKSSLHEKKRRMCLFGLGREGGRWERGKWEWKGAVPGIDSWSRPGWWGRASLSSGERLWDECAQSILWILGQSLEQKGAWYSLSLSGLELYRYQCGAAPQQFCHHEAQAWIRMELTQGEVEPRAGERLSLGDTGWTDKFSFVLKPVWADVSVAWNQTSVC